jgi:membrane protein DedA with SNARE-associated domain
MPSLTTAVTILGVVIFCCLLISLGAFFGKRSTLSKLLKYIGFIALIAIVGSVIYIAWIAFSSPEATNLVQTGLMVLGAIIGSCLLLVLGGYFGNKIEVFRVTIACGIIVFIAIIFFLIYIAFLTFLGK